MLPSPDEGRYLGLNLLELALLLLDAPLPEPVLLFSRHGGLLWLHLALVLHPVMCRGGLVLGQVHGVFYSILF